MSMACDMMSLRDAVAGLLLAGSATTAARAVAPVHREEAAAVVGQVAEAAIGDELAACTGRAAPSGSCSRSR